MEAVVQKLIQHEEQNRMRVEEVLANVCLDLLKNVQLHDYQMKGFRWLLAKYTQRLNPILGDEMGLGKTLQLISLIAALIAAAPPPSANSDEDDGAMRFLIVAPLSVLPNWLEQFGLFAPTIDVIMYVGSQKERTGIQAVITSKAAQPLVVVTSFEMMLNNASYFSSMGWNLMVLDEGHRFKNPKGKLYEVITTRMRVAHMIVLSGTPIQNDLQELFALLSLLNPSIFKDQELFEATFRDYFSAKAQQLNSQTQSTKSKAFAKAEKLMRQILSPLLLIRTIQDVNNSFTLPPISEIVVHTPLSPMQREYYKEIVARNHESFSSITRNRSNSISLLNILPLLRKACNHPYLFPGAEPEPFQEGSHLYENSGKLFVLHQILPRLKAEGHCVLLFSQSTAFLDIIQDFLTFECLSYERIDGSVRGKERWQSIERFRSDPDTFVFLISTRAGGVGLNLQRADTVIFADSDYNPQADLQAVARAYRLGQTKPIHVIKFLCASTVEESIYRRSLKKIQMADKIRNVARQIAVNDDMDTKSDENLMDMIQFGLHKLMMEAEDDESNALIKPLDEEYIQHILKRHTLSEEQPKEMKLKPDDLLEAGGDFCEENMYYFEGEDYSKSESKKKDQESLLKLCQSLQTNPIRQTKAARGRYEMDEELEENEDEDQETAEDAAERAQRREERRQKALAKKHATWKANNYESMVIDFNNEDNSAVTSSLVDITDTGRLYYVVGDASRPCLASLPTSSYIIMHCVDTSGVWCSRGFFRSLSALSPTIQRQYEAAGRNGDLKLGQAHLIPLPPESAEVAIATGEDQNPHHRPENQIHGYVCLLVVQGFVSKSKKQRVGNGGVATPLVRHGKSTMFRLSALKTALCALAQSALTLNASIHMPRIGYGTPNFNWYSVERLIKRELRDAGVVSTSIYYYSSNRRS